MHLQKKFAGSGSEIGHLKFVLTSGGKAAWASVTQLTGTPAAGGDTMPALQKGSLIINARVRMEPETLESSVREVLNVMSSHQGVDFRVDDLQCFSPAYPEPPYLVRETPTG